MKSKKVTVNRVLALLGIFAATLDMLFILLVGLLRTDYDSISSSISLLGVRGTPYAVVISIWWFFYGIMLVCFSVGLLRSMRKDNALRWIGPVLIAIFGVFDGIGTAVFPCDPGCAGLTFVSKMHVLVSAVGISALAVAPFFCALGWRGDPRWSRMRKFSGIVQVAAVLMLLILLFSRVNGVADFLNAYRGLLQRLLYGLYYLWLVPVGIHLYRLSGKPSS